MKNLWAKKGKRIMKTLNLYSVKERQPKDGELIFFWGSKNCFGDDYLFPELVKVEYTWIEVDEEGYATGLQYFYEENQDPPENCKLLLTNKGTEIKEDEMYSIPEEIAESLGVE
jgi:hypothetical protein